MITMKFLSSRTRIISTKKRSLHRYLHHGTLRWSPADNKYCKNRCQRFRPVSAHTIFSKWRLATIQRIWNVHDMPTKMRDRCRRCQCREMVLWSASMSRWTTVKSTTMTMRTTTTKKRSTKSTATKKMTMTKLATTLNQSMQRTDRQHCSMATAIAATTSRSVSMRTQHCHRRQPRAQIHFRAALNQIVYRIHHTKINHHQTMKGMQLDMRSHDSFILQYFQQFLLSLFTYSLRMVQHIDDKCRIASQKTTGTAIGYWGNNQRYQTKAACSWGCCWSGTQKTQVSHDFLWCCCLCFMLCIYLHEIRLNRMSIESVAAILYHFFLRASDSGAGGSDGGGGQLKIFNQYTVFHSFFFRNSHSHRQLHVFVCETVFYNLLNNSMYMWMGTLSTF